MKVKPKQPPQKSRRTPDKSIIPFPEMSNKPTEGNPDMEELIRRQMGIQWPVEWDK